MTWALYLTPGGCKDDISCVVCYLRYPRVMRILTGPPFYKEHDAEYARQATLGFDHVVVCGGTTANIMERELGVKVKVKLGARRRSQAERLVAWPEKPAGVTFTGETLRDRFEVRDDGLYLAGGTLVIVR